MLQLIDTHAHLDEEAFRSDVEEVVRAATEVGVSRILTIGITAATSEAAVGLSERFDNVFAVVGIQPNYASQVEAGDWETILKLVQHPRVVAVGETGLDRYWDYAPIDVQSDFFMRHLELSRETGKPFVVHCREAEEDVVEHLQAAAAIEPLNGVMHSFAGDIETARVCLDLGMYISFAGMVTYKKNKALREVAKIVPEDRLLVETDSPYLTPTPLRGKKKRNEPAFMVHTAECLADTRGVPVEQLAKQTSANAERLFGLA